MSKQHCHCQHCRSNRQLCCLLLRQCWATLSKQRSTLSKGRNFNANLVRHCCRFCNKVERCFDIVAKNGNNVEATFDIVAFDNVASTLLLVWSGLKLLLTTVDAGALNSDDSRNVCSSSPMFMPFKRRYSTSVGCRKVTTTSLHCVDDDVVHPSTSHAGTDAGGDRSMVWDETRIVGTQAIDGVLDVSLRVGSHPARSLHSLNEPD